ncbi:hypothetical protein MHYP_G00270560 [Metynnis hypsauchen]
MLLCCFWPQVDEDEPNEARQLRKAGRVKKEKKRRKERGSEEEQVEKLVEVQEEGGMMEIQIVVEQEKEVLEEEEVIEVKDSEEEVRVEESEKVEKLMNVAAVEEEEEMQLNIMEEQKVEREETEKMLMEEEAVTDMKKEEKQEEQDVEEEVKIEGNDRMDKEILLDELHVETAVVEEEKDEKKSKKKIRMVVVVIMEKEEKQQMLDIKEEVKVVETVQVLEEEVSVESPAVVEQKAELENIRDRTEEEMLLEEKEEKDFVAADLLCLPVCEESSDAASAEAELIQQLLEELLQQAVMKWTFTASDENVEQQLQEPSNSHSSAVAQTDHSRTQIKTEWVTKLKEEQEVSLALVTTDHSTCTANRADKSATEPDCESLDDGFNLDFASVMERNWLKCLRERDEQLRWSDNIHDVQRPDHHAEEQVCSISGTTTDNIQPITVQINDLLLNTTPHSTLIRLDERETKTIKVPFNHSFSVRLQDCEVMMLKMKMMRKRTWSGRLTELNETLPVVHPLISHLYTLMEPLQNSIASANKDLMKGDEVKLSGQTTTTLTSVYIPEKSDLLLDSMRRPEEQEEVKTIRTFSDNIRDQYQEFEMQILTMKVNWGRKSREKMLRGGLFFMLPKLEVQFMHDALLSDQEEME